MPVDPIRLLILAAHPDDAEYHAGGLAALYRKLGRCVKILALTDGRAGHHKRGEQELIAMRRREAARAGQVIGSSYQTLDFPDGQLQPTLEARLRVIQEMRLFKPDLVLTHRTCDYHPDHRAVGQIVQDASYLVTVPMVLPDVPPLRHAPVFAYMGDTFTRPARIRADVVLNVADYVDKIVAMLACHESQVFEWLAYEEGTLDTVPHGEAERLEWARRWFSKHMKNRVAHFRDDIRRFFGQEMGEQLQFVEVCEISEYGTIPDRRRYRELFPQNGDVLLGNDYHDHLHPLNRQQSGKLPASHINYDISAPSHSLKNKQESRTAT
jgi:LmbE family N-acetylglucosaminyl deacetylase